MPPAFRQCSFCIINSINNPNVVLFTVSDHIQRNLNMPPSDSISFICEQHFPPNDLKQHGTSKRLREGAVPTYFPRKEALSMDHNYILTSPLQLVSTSVLSISYWKLTQYSTGYWLTGGKFGYLFCWSVGIGSRVFCWW